MKPRNLKAYQQQLLPFIVFSLCATVIWLLGPKLSIKGLSLLATTEQRISIIAMLSCAWLLKFFFIDLQPSKPSKPQQVLSPEMQKQLARLQQQFSGAVQFLKNTILTKQERKVRLANLPWYLLLGPEGSGKTSLLANANINYVLAKQFKKETAENIAPSEICDWFVTRDLVLVDVPGGYLPSATPKSFLWQHFLQLLSGFLKKTCPQGIIISVNLPELAQQKRHDKQQLVVNLKKSLQDLTATFGRTLPIHLIITKCDLLPGFNEFFSEYSSEEAAQAWGFSLSATNATESTLDSFNQRFNNLIKRLNKQLLSRMHGERNPQARPFIKDFPLHVERLKDGIAQFIKALAFPDGTLQSVYLTSATQSATETTAAQSLTQGPANHNALQLFATPAAATRAYFIRQLLLQHLPMTQTVYSDKVSLPRWQQRLLYASAGVLIIVASIVLGRDFQHGVQQAYSMQSILAQYQVSLHTDKSNNHLLAALPLLNRLALATQHNNDKLSLAFYSKRAQETAADVYRQALQTIVLPEIKNSFEHYLQDAANKNPDQIYAVLHAYLLLAKPAPRDNAYIIRILQEIMSPSATTDDLPQLTQHIQAALTTQRQALTLHPEIIAAARKQLASLSNTALGYVILKNLDDNNQISSIHLGTFPGMPALFTIHDVASVIPRMFTAAAFNKIYNEQSLLAATQVLAGNSVLTDKVTHADPAAIQALSAQIRGQYVANYVDIWESLLANLRLVHPAKLSQLDIVLAVLTGSQSPLLQLLNTIKENTAFAPILSASPKLHDLSILLVDAHSNQTGGLYQIFKGLTQLHQYLQTLLSNPNPTHAIYTATSQRMQDTVHNDSISQLRSIAEQCPEPMKTWLNDITTQAWLGMLQESSIYLNTVWQASVFTPYQRFIMGRYPLNQDSQEDIDLTQFIAFFSPTGALSKFYQNYLQSFVMSNGKNLMLRTVDNQQLPISTQALNDIQYAFHLQHAFFPNGDNKLAVQFALQPLQLDEHSKGLTLTINGQEFSWQKGMPLAPRAIIWPGNNNGHATSVNFVNADNLLNSAHFKGDWGWFRLVSDATKIVRARNELVLSFIADNHQAKYLLLTPSTSINPFLPLNYTHFTLAEELE